MIKLIDALTLMDDFDRNGNPVPFQIKFFTMEGELIEIPQGVKCIGKKNDQVVFDKQGSSTKVKKNPNHIKNSTRNILLPNGQIRKCKIRLITQFNNKKVVY